MNTEKNREVSEWDQLEVYTIEEAARRLRCSYDTVWRGTRRAPDAKGYIKTCVYMAGRIPRAEIERLLRGE